MNPEKRLLVIAEYLSVELFVLLVCAILGSLAPKRMCVIEKLWTSLDLELLLLLFSLAFGVLIILSLLLRLDNFDDYVSISLLGFLYGLCALFISLER